MKRMFILHCLILHSDIQRHLKRKEYTTSAEFATEVELVFSNAFAFNQEHSPVWEDAVALRVSVGSAYSKLFAF
jgi:hypothetical protein